MITRERNCKPATVLRVPKAMAKALIQVGSNSFCLLGRQKNARVRWFGQLGVKQMIFCFPGEVSFRFFSQDFFERRRK